MPDNDLVPEWMLRQAELTKTYGRTSVELLIGALHSYAAAGEFDRMINILEHLLVASQNLDTGLAGLQEILAKVTTPTQPQSPERTHTLAFITAQHGRAGRTSRPPTLHAVHTLTPSIGLSHLATPWATIPILSALSTQAKNALHSSHIFYAYELITKSENELTKMGLDTDDLQRVKNYCQQLGMPLGIQIALNVRAELRQLTEPRP